MTNRDSRTKAKIKRKAKELEPRFVNDAKIAAAWCVLVCCVRNEMPRLAAFLRHYRKIGVAHFIFIDNQSTDGLLDFLSNQPDCSAWLAGGSYKDSNFGMDWCNYLLARYGVGKWCVTVDPDEFLMYPHCEYRSLRGLTRYMEGNDQPSLFAPLLDAYSDKRLGDTLMTAETDPFELCPFIDRFNLTQRFNEENQNFWVQGGVRLRRFFSERPEKAPALNKVPLIKWTQGLYYVSSMHHVNRPEYNCTILDKPLNVSGALLHFKYVNLLTEKAREEMSRGEHYAGSIEYKAYLDAGNTILYDPSVSMKWGDSRKLRETGFMQMGGWF